MVIICIMEIKSNDPFLGRRVRGYYLEELLDHGDLAMVYRARTEELWQDPELIVTILLVPETITKEARNQFTIRFMEKGKKLARLRHPHLHPLYGYGEQEGFFYLLTPPIQGETLTAHLLRGGSWNAVDVLSILLPLVSVVDYLHGQALICKFFNPAHVWLLSDQTVLLNGSTLVPLLLMQTLNQETTNRATYEHLKSISGTFLGAPEYLAPEVVKGAEADNRSDTYALGILLFELLSGSLPFSGKNYVDSAQKHLSEPLPSLHEILPDTPVALDIFINRASHYNVQYRFQTARELADAYAHIINTRFDAPKPGSLVRAIQQVGTVSVTGVHQVPGIDENRFLPKQKVSVTEVNEIPGIGANRFLLKEKVSDAKINEVSRVGEDGFLLKEKASSGKINEAPKIDEDRFLLKEKVSDAKINEAPGIDEDSFLLEGEDSLLFNEEEPEDLFVASEKNTLITHPDTPAASFPAFSQEAMQCEAPTEMSREKHDIQQTSQETMHERMDSMASQFHQLKERLQAQAKTYPPAPSDKN